MQFRYHLLIGFVVSYTLVFFFNLPIFFGVLLFISSWIVDSDHYLWYSLETKDWNPIHAVKWYLSAIPRWISLSSNEKEKFKRGVFIFHGICFWMVLLVLSFFNKIFLWILIGVLVHMFADLIDLYKRKEPLYNKIFPFYVIKTNKNKKGIEML
jgi:hypothetical protein